MKTSLIKRFLILTALIVPHVLLADVEMSIEDKVLYGDDDRVLTTELHSTYDAMILKQSKSVFAMVEKKSVVALSSTISKIRTTNLNDSLGICKDEKFASEPQLSTCSGFLIAPDILVTAGHCVNTAKNCANNVWLSDYEALSSYGTDKYIDVLAENKTIYGCKEIIKTIKTPTVDYAIVRLDRKVLDRNPLEFRKYGSVGKKDEFIVIGHPLGMPKTVTSNVVVKTTKHKEFFTVFSDTFQGNSGSPVINVKTNLVEGILVRGERDLVFNILGVCNKIKRCNFLTCRDGEAVQRITTLPQELLK